MVRNFHNSFPPKILSLLCPLSSHPPPPALPHSWACNDCEYWRHGKAEACPPEGGSWTVQVSTPGALSSCKGLCFVVFRCVCVLLLISDVAQVHRFLREGIAVLPAVLSTPKMGLAHAKWTYVGCFMDIADRLIPTELQVPDIGHARAPSDCLLMAMQRKFNTAGLSNGGECWVCNGAWLGGHFGGECFIFPCFCFFFSQLRFAHGCLTSLSPVADCNFAAIGEVREGCPEMGGPWTLQARCEARMWCLAQASRPHADAPAPLPSIL